VTSVRGETKNVFAAAPAARTHRLLAAASASSKVLPVLIDHLLVAGTPPRAELSMCMEV
jgi:hypothetical protein